MAIYLFILGVASIHSDAGQGFLPLILYNGCIGFLTMPYVGSILYVLRQLERNLIHPSQVLLCHSCDTIKPAVSARDHHCLSASFIAAAAQARSVLISPPWSVSVLSCCSPSSSPWQLMQMQEQQ